MMYIYHFFKDLLTEAMELRRRNNGPIVLDSKFGQMQAPARLDLVWILMLWLKYELIGIGLWWVAACTAPDVFYSEKLKLAFF